MSKSSKAEKPFSEKLKQWFKGTKSNLYPHGEEIRLSGELVDSISPSISPLQERLKILKDLKESVRNGRLQDKGVEVLLYKTKDLLRNDSPDVRHIVLSFYESLVYGQYSRLGLVRSAFFNIIKENHSKRGSADFTYHIDLLYVLTGKGKDIVYFEDELGPFIKETIPFITPQLPCTLKFLEMITNCFIFNATYLDSDVVLALITLISSLCTSTNDKNETKSCLEVLNSIICYSYIPKNGLLLFISILCRVVNLEAYGKDAWDITRRLMGTHLGHSALYCLSMIVQTTENRSDVALIRGAIFFIGFSLWGHNRIKSLDYSAVTILPTFVHALKCKHHLVVFEVIQQVKQLVTFYDKELHAAACDAIVELIELLLIEVRRLEKKLQDNISSHLHAVITILEGLSEMKRYSGSKQKLFGMLDLCADHRPEESVIRLITFRQKSIHAAKSKWLNIFSELVERYYKKEKRVNIRIKTLDVILDIFKSNHYSFEEELIDRIIIPFLGSVHMEPESRIRRRAIEVLTTLCSLCQTNKNLDLLNILGCIMKRSLEQEAERDTLLKDLLIVVYGLINVFKDKLRQLPSTFILRVLSLLTTHLEYHYDHPNIFGGKSDIRYVIFRLFLSLRAEDESYHLGLEESDGSVYFSPYIICRSPEEEEEAELLWNRQQESASRPSSPSCLSGTRQKSVLCVSLNKACLLVIECLERETDWNVLCLVLTRVPTVLQNRPLICRYGKSINKFITPLVSFTDKNSNFPLHLTNTPSKFSKSDFHNHIFPVLAALASYNEFLVPASQSSLIRALELGLLSKECNRMCIVALTTSALEMKRSTRNLIPEVLLNFSKISATKFISTPILEFLSTMVRLPEVFSCFTDTNYITVFAIALPFTNPFKFDPYTVSLAHHVIVMWFLKCRLSYRQNFVQFIITSLNSNIFVPFEENDKNKDSMGRMRSTSLSAARRPNVALAAKKDIVADVPKSTQIHPLAFHQELTETCLDILARYMYGNVSVKTRRLKTSDFILKNGHSATWLIGTMLITVSTSCCTHIAMRNGVCDRCYFYCIRDGTLSKDDITKNSDRRRHMSDFYSGTNKSQLSNLRSDKELHRHTSLERMESSGDDYRVKKVLPETCSCWCSGWAEIYIRRPSGDVSWMCRVQNTQLLSAHTPSTNLRELTALFDTSLKKDTFNFDVSTESDKINVDNLTEDEYKKLSSEFVPSSVSSPSAETDKTVSGNRSHDEEMIVMSPKSPVKKTKSSPPDTSCQPLEVSDIKRKSCDPIPEVEEDLRSGTDLRRRQSDAWRKSLPPSNEENQNNIPLNSSPNSSFESNLNEPAMRTTRSHTISVSSPRNRVLNKPLQPTTGIVGRPGIGGIGSGEKNDKVSGISPQFVFLMLYQSSTFGNAASLEKPLLLPSNKITENSIKNLDRIPAHETHKIGVLYIGPNQVNDEVGILRNISGSSRYTDFLDGLGNLINIRNIDKSTHFIGGLDSEEGDGNFAYMWEDDVMQVIFHVATLMPNHDNDPQANKKKRHIGNNYVAIVYNDSRNHSESYKMGTVRGKFISACIVITPLDQGSNRVCVDCKPELKEPLGHVMDPKIVSDKSLSILVRQWALHCNLAAQIQKSLSNKMPYSSNWLERLRAIKRLKEKLQKENEMKEEEDREQGSGRPQLNDFTEFVIMRKKKGNGGSGNSVGD
ncbi:tuberin [Lepeophtheirus salmonis]|uniref:tuberin n=1 Tax=Lepeophtheirus salmonis TaxID=72036 RepID=UPI001AE146A0|nr:tuberin-like [Lepeophtheirus salmonis]